MYPVKQMTTRTIKTTMCPSRLTGADIKKLMESPRAWNDQYRLKTGSFSLLPTIPKYTRHKILIKYSELHTIIGISQSGLNMCIGDITIQYIIYRRYRTYLNTHNIRTSLRK